MNLEEIYEKIKTLIRDLHDCGKEESSKSAYAALFGATTSSDVLCDTASVCSTILENRNDYPEHILELSALIMKESLEIFRKNQ